MFYMLQRKVGVENLKGFAPRVLNRYYSAKHITLVNPTDTLN